MKCRKIIALLGPYLDGECAPEERRRVEKHLRQCPACRSELELLGRIEADSRRLVQPDPGEDYWTSFLPEVRQRIDRDRPQLMPGGFIERIRRLFAPPMPWFRLAGTVAVAVLVLVIGRAVIRQENRLEPFRSPVSGPLSDQVRPAGRDRGRSAAAVNEVVVDGERRAETVPAGEAPAAERIETAPAGKMAGEIAGKILGNTGEMPQPDEPAAFPDERSESPSEPAQSKKEAPETQLSADPEALSPEVNGFITEEEVKRPTDAPMAAGTVSERASEAKIHTMDRATSVEDWRERIRHWETIIASPSDESTLTMARLSLAESWYQVTVSSTDPDDVSAALRAHRAALEFAAADSTRQRLRERISTLENRQQKK